MSDRNEALRLADWLQAAVQTYPQMSYDEPGGYCTEVDQVMDESAAALRRLTAEQAVMREWIAEALPVLASIDDCEDMGPIRALLESGNRLVEGGPDDLLKGVG